MAQTTENRNFRKVDVDKYDEDQYQEEATTSSERFSDSEVSAAINARNFEKAIKLICNSSIISSDQKNQKIILVDSFVRLNSSIKSANINEISKLLSEDEMNNLVKVIYMVFALRPEADQTLMHVWFEKTFQQVGHGAIVRAMTDRKALIFQ
ncbi:hypothetical protein MXB_2282 [Myxobolus squamalis]|nr:hypothetical protein MXB_2282 [Myxobolus squamalis]